MPATVTVAVPVLNGASFLPELLDALARQDCPHRLLVIDSGSTDGSQDLITQYGGQLHSISKADFGHGRTRNLFVELAGTDLVAFLTQDATPGEGWLTALTEPFADEHVAASYGPQRPRPGADARTARVLRAVYAGPDLLVSEGSGWHPIFSDVNSCVRVKDLLVVPFRDVPYAEDFHLERDLLAAGRQIAYCSAAAVVHSNSYSVGEHWGRMLDEAAALPPPARLRWRSVAKNLALDCGADLREAHRLPGLAAELQRAVADVSRVRWPRLFEALYRRWSLEHGTRRRHPLPPPP